MSNKVLVATGTSQNKQNYAVRKITEYLSQKGVADVEVLSENVYTMDLAGIDPDVIVLIGPKTFETSVPVIDGRGFITKIESMEASALAEVLSHVG